MDAELIMFLHDLVSAYLKEKEKGEYHILILGIMFFSFKLQERQLSAIYMDF